MPFKPNYNTRRADRRRAQQQKQEEKQQRREEKAAQRKAARAETLPADDDPANTSVWQALWLARNSPVSMASCCSM